MPENVAFPLVISVTPVQVDYSQSDRGAFQVTMTVNVQVRSLLEVDPKRCIRRTIIANHLQDDSWINAN